MKEEKEIREEVHKEFQVERMILFSDAVFAIVITLMAIEIHIPESAPIVTQEQLIHALLHLLPTILAYIVSFVFIGASWYQHLKLFGTLKSFDGKLVFYNLLFLFTIGLFPFTATVIARTSGSNILGFILYLGVICLCLLTLTLLERYILISKPALRNDNDISALLKTHADRAMWVISMFVMVFLVGFISYSIEDPSKKSMAMVAFTFFPLVQLILKKLNRRKKPKKTTES